MPIDEGVGQIRETLERLELDKNTVVLFFSDNGASGDFPSGSESLRGSKSSVYEGGHKVPFIAWWPDHIQPGTSNDTPAMTIDIMPTLMSLAGAEPSEDRPLDGVDLSNLLLEGESLPDRNLYWASLNNGGNRSEAMRAGPWKLVVKHPQATPGSFENEKFELYHLEDDPGEKQNVASEHPERVEQMAQQLKSWYAETQENAAEQRGGWLSKTN